MVLEMLDCFTMCGKDNAVKSAENFRFLRKKGITIRKTTDMIIGTFCILNNIPLLFADRDFDPLVEQLGLKRIL
jgi:predicted nucleic acid-binding protein